jgi:hypothetical protein
MGVGRTMRRRMPERLSGAVVVAAATSAHPDQAEALAEVLAPLL